MYLIFVSTIMIILYLNMSLSHSDAKNYWFTISGLQYQGFSFTWLTENALTIKFLNVNENFISPLRMHSPRSFVIANIRYHWDLRITIQFWKGHRGFIIWLYNLNRIILYNFIFQVSTVNMSLMAAELILARLVEIARVFPLKNSSYRIVHTCADPVRLDINQKMIIMLYVMVCKQLTNSTHPLHHFQKINNAITKLINTTAFN